MTAIWEEHLVGGTGEFSPAALQSAQTYFQGLQLADLSLLAYLAACYMKGFDAGRKDSKPEVNISGFAIEKKEYRTSNGQKWPANRIQAYEKFIASDPHPKLCDNYFTWYARLKNYMEKLGFGKDY